MGQLDVIVLSVFMALEGVHAYSAFLPSVFTIRTFVKDDLGATMIREGEVFASIFLVALGIVVSLIVKSPLPLVFAGITGAGMLAVYERALVQSGASGIGA